MYTTNVKLFFVSFLLTFTFANGYIDEVKEITFHGSIAITTKGLIGMMTSERQFIFQGLGKLWNLKVIRTAVKVQILNTNMQLVLLDSCHPIAKGCHS